MTSPASAQVWSPAYDADGGRRDGRGMEATGGAGPVRLTTGRCYRQASRAYTPGRRGRVAASFGYSNASWSRT